MPIDPPEPRHMIEDDGEVLRITIPSPKRRYPILALGFGLVWIVVFSVFFSRSIFSPNYEGESWFPYFWVLGMILASAYTIAVLLWLLFGVEVIKVDYANIKIRRQIFGLGRTRDYGGDHIRRLRAAPIVYATTGYRSSFTWEYLGLSGGQIAFDYGAKTARFGSGLDEAEARMIVDAITQRFHRYQRK
jgi:hypothetical protein